jgi:hypothetical protein
MPSRRGQAQAWHDEFEVVSAELETEATLVGYETKPVKRCHVSSVRRPCSSLPLEPLQFAVFGHVCAGDSSASRVEIRSPKNRPLRANQLWQATALLLSVQWKDCNKRTHESIRTAICARFGSKVVQKNCFFCPALVRKKV